MRLLDILRKVGILRYGAVKGTYRSTKDMPDELAFDGVYDADADQLHRSDLQRPAPADAEGDLPPDESPPMGKAGP